MTTYPTFTYTPDLTDDQLEAHYRELTITNLRERSDIERETAAGHLTYMLFVSAFLAIVTLAAHEGMIAGVGVSCVMAALVGLWAATGYHFAASWFRAERNHKRSRQLRTGVIGLDDVLGPKL
jgi:hypothetical protein